MNNNSPDMIHKSKRSPHRMLGWTIMRIFLLIIMLAWIGMFIAGVFDFQTYVVSHPVEFIPYTPTWTPQIFSQILAQLGLSFTVWVQFTLVTSTINALVFWFIGFLIFFRKGMDWFGLYLGVMLVLFGAVSGNTSPVFSGMNPEFNWIFIPMGAAGWWGLFLLLFLFPNGRFVPRWTRWIAWILLVIYGLNVLVLEIGGGVQPTLVLAILATLGIGIGSQVYRYRKVSNPFERQQTKWVMAAMVVVAVVLIISMSPAFLPDLIDPGSPGNRVALIFSILPNFFSALLPLSVAFAILRYRLWDIDLIIRSTLQYGLLSLLLGLLYFGMVTLLQTAFVGFSQQQSPLVLVLSTLAIAAIFNPLRRRIQQIIDRRFYRQKYNAERILTEFSASVQNEVDGEILNRLLLDTVAKTIQPESLGLWIRSETSSHVMKGES